MNNMKDAIKRSMQTTVATLLMLIGLMSHAADMVVYFHPDAQGSAVAAYNESGMECWRQQYSPYGEKIAPSDQTPTDGCGLIGSERGFTGHVQDSSGLVYMQQRYYDPQIMRFLQIDPKAAEPGDERTYNRYSYAANNPYKYVDPDGQAFFLAPLAPAAFGAAKGLAAFAVKEVAAAVASKYTGGLSDYASVGSLAKKYLKQNATHAVRKGAKRGPKTDPNAPHNKKIREIGDQVEDNDGVVIAGGGRSKERLIPTPGGHKNGRRPDVLLRDCDGNLCGINVGKTKADGSPIKREQEALDDLNGAGLPTTFQRYD